MGEKAVDREKEEQRQSKEWIPAIQRTEDRGQRTEKSKNRSKSKYKNIGKSKYKIPDRGIRE